MDGVTRNLIAKWDMPSIKLEDVQKKFAATFLKSGKV